MLVAPDVIHSTLWYFPELSKKVKSYAPSNTSEDLVKVIFQFIITSGSNPSAACNNKHQNSLSSKTFIHNVEKMR